VIFFLRMIVAPPAYILARQLLHWLRRRRCNGKRSANARSPLSEPVPLSLELTAGPCGVATRCHIEPRSICCGVIFLDNVHNSRRVNKARSRRWLCWIWRRFGEVTPCNIEDFFFADAPTTRMRWEGRDHDGGGGEGWGRGVARREDKKSGLLDGAGNEDAGCAALHARVGLDEPERGSSILVLYHIQRLCRCETPRRRKTQVRRLELGRAEGWGGVAYRKCK
jgi:hypothetical protein